MLRLTGKGSTHTCDGVTRRDFLQAGTLGSDWSHLGRPGGRRGPRECRGPARRPLGDHDLQSRRSQPIGHLGSQARRAGGDSRPVQTNPHQRSRHRYQRDFSEDGPACRQVLAGAKLLSYRCRRPRHGASDVANRPALHRRHQLASRRLRLEPTCAVARPTCRPTSFCPSRWAARGATCRTARTPDSWARRMIRSP